MNKHIEYKVARIKQKAVIISLLSTLFCILSTNQIDAASFELSVSPPIFEIELTPPAVADVNEQIILENTGDDGMNLEIDFRLFRPQDKNGDIVYLKKGDLYGDDPLILKRIRIMDDDKEIHELYLSPHTKKKLNLIITIPKDEPPSDYYFSILFSSKEDEKQNNGSYTESIGGVAVNTLLSIGPKDSTKGSIEEFSTDFFRTEGPVPFVVTIHNKSKHFISPQASIAIRNMFGQTIGKIELLPVNILSESSRSLPSKEQFVINAQETDEDKKTKKQNATILKLISHSLTPVAVWPESFLLGPYSATLTVALSENGPLYVKTIHFFAFPLHILIGFIIAILLLLTIKHRLAYKKV
ncbi:MAG: hypothetical protein HZC02_02085 [Candidatus Levybacteria bacterium]|nr:hypothetical protein [Candidatus Levybacteria bacterium]